MLTAHAPAGYIAARLLIRLKPPHLPAWQWSLIGIIGGLLPDVDMLWFYFIDHGHVHINHEAHLRIGLNTTY